jgi:hypothetical protein
VPQAKSVNPKDVRGCHHESSAIKLTLIGPNMPRFALFGMILKLEIIDCETLLKNAVVQPLYIVINVGTTVE